MKAQGLLLALLLASGFAYADHTADHEKSRVPQQDLSRRAYAAPTQGKTETIEGNVADVGETKAEKNYKTLQLHMLGKRPYAEKNSD